MNKHTRAGLLAAVLVGAGAVTASALAHQQTSPLSSATPHVRDGHGRVVERLQAGSYGYLRLDEEPRESWFVVMGTAPSIGTKLKFRTYAVANDFHSPRLKRRFERIYFTSIKPQGTSK